MNSHKFLPVKAEDTKDIAVFLSSIFEEKSVNFWLGRLSLFWEMNPAFQENGDRGFLVKEDGEIIGFLAKFPSKVQFDGKVILAGNASALAVHPEHRRKAIGCMLRQVHYEKSKDTIVFATTPERITVRINDKFGFKLLPDAVGQKHHVFSIFVANPMNFLKYNHYFYHVTKLLKPLAPMISYLFKSYQYICMISFRKRLSRAKDLMVREVSKADSTFDELWDETKHYYIITNVRTSDVINWYLDPACLRKKHLYACYRDDKLLGYMMFQEYNSMNTMNYYCVDVWYRKDEKYVLESIVSHAISEATNKSVGAIILPHYSQDISNIFSNFGLIKYKTLRTDYFLAPDWISRKINSENSYFVYLQGDKGF